MSCPTPPGEEHYPINTQDNEGHPIVVCAKCQQVIG